MSGKNIAILSPFFFPEIISTGRYNQTMAEELRNCGDLVTVICLHPFYPSWKVRNATEQLAGIKAVRGGRLLKFPTSSLLRRLVLEIYYAIYASWYVWRLRKQVDTVIAVFPPSLFFLLVSFLLPRKVARVGVVHDLQGIHAKASRSRLVRGLVGMIRFIERRSFNSCDRLVLLSNAMADAMHCMMGVAREKMTVVYPFVNIPDYNKNNNRLKQLFPDGYKHLVYSGALGDKQMPNLLAPIFATLLQRIPNLYIQVFSGGPHFNWLKRQALENSDARISFHDLVSEDDISELYFRADVQIIPQAFGTQHGSMPSKLPNIMASGRPIIAICDDDSELANMIKRFGAGEVVNSWDPEVVTNALLRILGQAEQGEPISYQTESVRDFFSVNRLVSALRDVNA